MIILGLDPGLGTTGWGVIAAEGNRLRHLANGQIRTDPSMPLPRRLANLYNALIDVIRAERPDGAAVEEVLGETWPDDKHAVIMLHGGPRGETLTLVTTKEGLKRDEMRQKLSDLGMAEIAIPKKVLIMEDLPLLSTGKVDYVTLDELLRAKGEEE